MKRWTFISGGLLIIILCSSFQFKWVVEFCCSALLHFTLIELKTEYKPSYIELITFNLHIMLCSTLLYYSVRFKSLSQSVSQKRIWKRSENYGCSSFFFSPKMNGFFVCSLQCKLYTRKKYVCVCCDALKETSQYLNACWLYMCVRCWYTFRSIPFH